MIDTRPRVLLVEDDPSLARFVALALEDLDVALVSCASVSEALAALREAPVQLVVTDLMLPGESGVSLLQRLHDDPPLRAGARLAVFSAGLDQAMRQQLGRYDLFRLLAKPVSVQELAACVSQAIAHAPGPPPAPGGQTDPVLDHFGGDAGLHAAFRASAIAQFPNDLDEGDRACASGDLQALRRVAHSLKSVLRLLGNEQASITARATEDSAVDGDAPRATEEWGRLRAQVAALCGAARPS